MKMPALRSAFALFVCVLLLPLEGCDMEADKVVTYEPVSRESLTPEQLKSLENLERMQGGAAPNQIGEQALQEAQEAQKKQEAEAAGGGAAKR